MIGIIDQAFNRKVFLVFIPILLLGTATRNPRGEPDKLPKLVQDFVAVWDSRDEGAIDRVFAPDVVLQNIPEEMSYTGRDAVKAYVGEFSSWAMDLKMTIKDYRVAGRFAVVEWTWSGILHGDLPAELNIVGKPFSVPGVSILELRDGQVTHCTNYYDAAALLHQLDGHLSFPSSELVL